ncbi:hypothetical protein DMN91_000329 [Ooceraea biroi]|uniref:SAP domain-containing protein n=1 Tax=Ooceraea biroi TaxID=2015173 RepID=A0A3L8E252_OOCBI|nr:hypothetical protein DMN91_000329 [Ooceraea biroi]
MASSGSVAECTVAQLKELLRAHGLSSSGNRADLLIRVRDHIPELWNQWHRENDARRMEQRTEQRRQQVEENATGGEIIQNREVNQNTIREPDHAVSCELKFVRRERDLLRRELDLLRENTRYDFRGDNILKDECLKPYIEGWERQVYFNHNITLVV